MLKTRSFILTALVLALFFPPNGAVNVSQPASAAVGVLFDTGHQKDASDISGYSSMIDDLTSQGFHFSEDSDGEITEEDLSTEHILVIVEPDNVLSESEIHNIHGFISTGHSLLVISDELDDSARAAVNTLLSPYGIRQSDMLSSSGIYIDFTSHAITEGVSRYDQNDTGAKLDVVDSQAHSLIRDDDGDTLVAAWNGGARVVVVSDESSLRGSRYNSANKNILIRGIFNWLADVEPPVANFSAEPRTGEIPLRVQFTNRSIGNVAYWLWDFGDGTGSSEQNPSHTYDKFGRYNVRLQVMGPDGADFELKRDYINLADVSGGVAEVEVAKFTISDIDIEPSRVLPGDMVTVSVNVLNSEGITGDYQVALIINGDLEDSQLLSLPPHSSRSVVFNITKTIPGVYKVLIESQSGQFIVNPSIPDASTINPGSIPQNSGGLSLPAIIGIIVGSVGTAIAIVIVTRRRRRVDYIYDLEKKYQKVLDDLEKIKQSLNNTH
jgi:PKD repeat protein